MRESLCNMTDEEAMEHVARAGDILIDSLRDAAAEDGVLTLQEVVDGLLAARQEAPEGIPISIDPVSLGIPEAEIKPETEVPFPEITIGYLREAIDGSHNMLPQNLPAIRRGYCGQEV